MKPKASPLNIIDFAIINFEINFSPPKKEGAHEDLREYFPQYSLDIDFDIHSDSILQVFIKARINKDENSLPGYIIYAEICCLFSFDESAKITQEARNNIEGFSTIYMALNNLRGFISQITANAPIGRYILPSIDLNDLIEKKKQKIQSQNSKEAPSVNKTGSHIKKKKVSKKTQ